MFYTIFMKNYYSVYRAILFVKKEKYLLDIFLHLWGKIMYEQTAINLIKAIGAKSVCKNCAGIETP